MDMRALVGRNFARIRREKDLTQEAIGTKAGFTQPYLSGLEKGRRNPSIVSLYEIAQAMGVGVLDLLEGADAPDKKPRKRSS
jgi:transcriptional regulator with XRE-family HTH domain